MNWEQAACQGYDTNEFFVPQVSDVVRELCDACPIRSECLEYAIETEAVGWWGGTSWRARQRIVAARLGASGSEVIDPHSMACPRCDCRVMMPFGRGMVECVDCGTTWTLSA